MKKNLFWAHGNIKREDREKLLKQKGLVIWLTGLSGSGKSSIARKLEEILINSGRLAYVLDGDNVRHGLNSDLGFSDADRNENIRRIGEVAALFFDAGVIVITAFISPFRKDRDLARSKVPTGRFIEVFVDAPLSVCEERDPKGLYKKAREKEIGNFTGIGSDYEPPLKPEIKVQTDKTTVEESVKKILRIIPQFTLQ